MKRFQILLLPLFFLFASNSLSAQLNPCDGDKVGIKAGTGTVEIQRRSCDMIMLSYDQYFGLEVAAKQNDSLKTKTLAYLNIVESNIALRDSIDHLRSGHIAQQDTAIVRYQKLITQYQKASEDALANAQFAERKLTFAKLKTGIFTVAGGVIGILAGVLVGKTL